MLLAMPVHKAEALFDFQPTAAVELQLKKGDVVMVKRMSVGEGWWEGELNGQRGLFPSSYVKLLAPGSPPDRPKTPLTPRTSKKASMESLLAPAYSTQEEIYDPEKAMELFVPLHTEIKITVGPRWDCLPPTLTITIKELPPERTRFSGVKQHSVYNVETKEHSSCVTRKFKHFLWLYDRLAEGFPCVSLPPLPVKQFSGSESTDARLRGLQRFLTRVARHPVLGSTKLLRDFLTIKDDKDWKIGRQLKFLKSSKKLFHAPVYYTVKYPPHNVPLNQLASIEKFSRFSRLLEMNVNTIQHSYQQLSMAHNDVNSCVNFLGRDFERFSKGLQPTTGVQRRKLQAATNLQASVANGQSSFYTVTPQKSAAEPEEESSGDETDCGAWNWRENERFSVMMKDIHDIASKMRQMTSVHQHHQDALEHWVVETLQEYVGIIHTLPVLVKLHEEGMEIFNSSREKDSKKEAEEVRQNCETLNNVLLAEFDYFSRVMVDDFENMMLQFLRRQAEFHKQMAEEWESLHRKFAARISKHRGGSSSHSPSPFLKSKSFTLSTTSSHGSTSSLPRGRDLDPADSHDRPGSDSSLSYSGGPTPQPPSCPPPKSIPSDYVNIDTLSGKSAAVLSGEEEDRENVGGYKTPWISVKKEKDEEDEEQEEGEEKEEEKEYRKVGPHPSYANWQFLSLQTSNPTKPTSVCVQKKPVPIQRKLPVGTDPGLAPPPSSVPKKPLTLPKPKMLQLSTKPTSPTSPTSKTSSIKPVNESTSMRMPTNPAHPPSSAHNTKPSATPNSSSTDGTKTKGASGGKSVQPPPETKPRSYTTSTLKQPLLPPVKGSTLFSSKSPQQIPKEQSSDTPLSPVQEMEADTSQFEASSDPSPTDTTKLLAKGHSATTAVSNPSTSKDGPAAKSAKPTSSGGREELMRKLSIRRQKLEQQIQVTVNKADSPTSQSTITPAAAERTSEHSHDSSSSTQSELVLAYRRTDESPSSSTGNVDGSVVLRKPDSEKEGNLAKYGIIEDVNGGSFVI